MKLYSCDESGERLEVVSTHENFGDGWAAGQYAVHKDREGTFMLYQGRRRVARFGYGRLAKRTPSRGAVDMMIAGIL